VAFLNSLLDNLMRMPRSSIHVWLQARTRDTDVTQPNDSAVHVNL